MKTERITLRGVICDQLNDYCKRVNRTKEQVVNMALQQYLILPEIAPNIIEAPEIIPVEDSVPMESVRKNKKVYDYET